MPLLALTLALALSCSLSPCHRAHVPPAQRLSSLRSDPPRLFGDRIELMLQEVDFDLQVRDLPRQFFVLDDELLEEGKDLFVGSLVVHGSDAWCVRSSHSAVGTRTTERRGFPLEGRESGRKA